MKFITTEPVEVLKVYKNEYTDKKTGLPKISYKLKLFDQTMYNGGMDLSFSLDAVEKLKLDAPANLKKFDGESCLLTVSFNSFQGNGFLTAEDLQLAPKK